MADAEARERALASPLWHLIEGYVEATHVGDPWQQAECRRAVADALATLDAPASVAALEQLADEFEREAGKRADKTWSYVLRSCAGRLRAVLSARPTEETAG